jgi:hypothetical protein
MEKDDSCTQYGHGVLISFDHKHPSCNHFEGKGIDVPKNPDCPMHGKPKEAGMKMDDKTQAINKLWDRLLDIQQDLRSIATDYLSEEDICSIEDGFMDSSDAILRILRKMNNDPLSMDAPQKIALRQWELNVKTANEAHRAAIYPETLNMETVDEEENNGRL